MNQYSNTDLPLSFIYNTGKITVPASDTVEYTLSIKNNHDFHAKYLTLSIMQSDAVITNWAGTIDVEDAGQSWFNLPITAISIGGNGQFPYVFDPRRKISANSALLITLVDVSGTETEVEFAMHGYKVPIGYAGELY